MSATGDGVDGAAARGPDRARDDRRHEAGGDVPLDRLAQGVGTQCERIVDVD
jgi:hypothetical protein